MELTGRFVLELYYSIAGSETFIREMKQAQATAT